MPPAMRQIAKIRMYQSASVSRIRAHIVASLTQSKGTGFPPIQHLSEREEKFDSNVGRFSRFRIASFRSVIRQRYLGQVRFAQSATPRAGRVTQIGRPVQSLTRGSARGRAYSNTKSPKAPLQAAPAAQSRRT